ncbi:Organic solvent tolerance protein [Gluconacetobacter diazotrophicus PA1 5]|uniref:LPS-assembly protein LptD n=2 Tax=Gluconacetobacter diazotrophicus TaxID=33996 RepID=A9H1L1_GLUDA|nr:Organic solvent tolerance protein [Gluconacetobacter diazotrophicus PA1 5]MBB2155485.1 LPS-assembly protein LptD [Gluconacetobacter diazotrophicus]CAP57270.1 Organic solvent tolerance protein precursor [Gluconacetobacter diazotrophicus PA1 5]
MMPILMSRRLFRPARGQRSQARGTLLAAGLLGSTFLGAVIQVHRAHAQVQAKPIKITTGSPMSQSAPVTFQADTVTYDNARGIVTWTGNVQIWQEDHVLRADTVTYDRNTGIAAAHGHVAMVEPDGTVIFSDYAELSNGMRDGIMTRLHMLMTENAKLAANGMRRTGAKVNDMARAVYTACNICAQHPERPPFWQLRAYDAIDDTEHKRIDFRDAYLDMFGIPVMYMPAFSMSDPSVKRQSGFLTPGITPHDRYLGAYVTIPYYWVIDKQSDMTIQGLLSTRTGPQVSTQYRNALNFGTLNILAGLAYDTNRQGSYVNTFGNTTGTSDEHGIQGYIFAQAQASITRAWRAGANINLATSADYMRDYRVSGYGQEMLTSNVYLEGFGTGSYSRVDAQAYQGLNQGVIRDNELPWVLPRYTYSYFGQPDAWGGRLAVDTTDFYVYRASGVSDQRGQLSLNWDRPFRNHLGQLWKLTLHLESAIHRATSLNQQPIYAPTTTRQQITGQVLPTVALKMNWPFLRGFMNGKGTQILEPIAQVIAAPNTGNSRNSNLPNEDSLSYEFTDSTLFAINRYPGTDRLDGGLRGNFGVHGNWTWNGHEIDTLVGESLQEHIDHNRIPYSGLNHHFSDVVARARFAPNQYIDFTGRTRIDPYAGRIDFGDALVSTGVKHFHLTSGYVYEPVTPYYYYATNIQTASPNAAYYVRTNEVTVGANTNWQNYSLSAFVRRSLSRQQFVSMGGNAGYNNDCFGFNLMYIKQYTSIGGQQRNSTIMFTLTFKTIGAFGIRG